MVVPALGPAVLIAPLGAEEALLLHLVEEGIKGALAEVEVALAAVLEVLDHLVAVHGLAVEEPEDEEPDATLEELGVAFHGEPLNSICI